MTRNAAWTCVRVASSRWGGSRATTLAVALLIVGTAAARPPAGGEDRSTGGAPRDKRRDPTPAIGERAPNFQLEALDGGRDVELASFKGSKPVVLIFGSYT